MDENYDNGEKIGSIKSSLNYYVERMSDSYSPRRKNLKDVSENPSPTKRELHSTRRNTSQFRDNTRDAEAARAKTESELSDAKKTVKDLALRIEESNSRVKKIEELEKQTKSRELEPDQRCSKREDDRYVEIIKELDYIKQEIRKLKADMALVLDQKRNAEKETEASSSKIKSYSSSVEVLRKEIDELNEEHVLVELARIEANKEYKEIEAKRKEEARQHSSVLEETRKKVSGLNDLFEESNSTQEHEKELADTTYDVNTLKNELALVMSMDTKKPENLNNAEGQEPESPSFLQLVLEELEAAKKELALINEEGFQFTASMDIIRDEVKHLSEEIARLKKTEEKADLTVQSLNSKLLRAKLKLEAVCAAVEEANSISSSLEVALEQLKTEAEAAKREQELISEDTAKMKAEVPKIESEINLVEARLEAAIQELRSVKSSEAIALENLKDIVENSMRSRASASQNSSTITISTFEYEYLKGKAAGAEEIADKKVAAAQAWIEALKASEKEILMKTEITHRELRMEERKLHEAEEPILTRASENEVRISGRKSDKFIEPKKMQLEIPSRKSVNKNGIVTPSRRTRARNSASPANRHLSKSNSNTFDRKRKGVPTLAKFLSSNNTERSH